jgi:hypothetical protein
MRVLSRILAAEKAGALRCADPFVLAAPLLVLMLPTLLRSDTTVLSSDMQDLSLQFLPWRQFGFSEIARGNLPLWNPHSYSGTPFLANFQSALFYPPNYLHLLLPVGWAMNLILISHLWLAGQCTYGWCRDRGLSRPASLMAGWIFCLGSQYYTHLFPGHVAFLITACWTPLIFRCADRILGGGDGCWIGLAALAIAMQCLGGYPQTVYYTALALAVYIVLNLRLSRAWLRATACAACAYVLGFMLAAVQLLPGIVTAGECVRSEGTTYDYSSSFSLPPENLLLALCPTALGDMRDMPYFGRWLLWEVSTYVGLTTLLLLSLLSVILLRTSTLPSDRTRRARLTIDLVMVGLLLLAAVGRYSGVHLLLFRALPFYSSFRGPTKFTYIAALILALLAGTAFDLIWRSRVRGRPIILVSCFGVVVAVLMSAAAVHLLFTLESADSWWARVRAMIAASNTTFAPSFMYSHPSSDAVTARFASKQLLIFAGLLIIASGSLGLSGRNRRFALLLPIVLVGELTFVAHRFTASAPIVRPYPAEFVEAARRAGQLTRVMHADPALRNEAIARNDLFEIWGYDQVVLTRYAEFISASQVGQSFASADVPIKFAHRGLTMLRCALTLETSPGAAPRHIVRKIGRPLPQALLVSNAEVIPDKTARLERVLGTRFDPWHTVILERHPSPSPDPAGTGGVVSVIDQDTDRLDLDVTLATPAILLITDSYSPDWRAEPFGDEPSPQASYEILPANHTLRAIPLAAGRHRIRLSYAPLSFRVGMVLSICSCVVLSILLFLSWRSRRASRRALQDVPHLSATLVERTSTVEV